MTDKPASPLDDLRLEHDVIYMVPEEKDGKIKYIAIKFDGENFFFSQDNGGGVRFYSVGETPEDNSFRDVTASLIASPNSIGWANTGIKLSELNKMAKTGQALIDEVYKAFISNIRGKGLVAEDGISMIPYPGDQNTFFAIKIIDEKLYISTNDKGEQIKYREGDTPNESSFREVDFPKELLLATQEGYTFEDISNYFTGSSKSTPAAPLEPAKTDLQQLIEQAGLVEGQVYRYKTESGIRLVRIQDGKLQIAYDKTTNKVKKISNDEAVNVNDASISFIDLPYAEDAPTYIQAITRYMNASQQSVAAQQAPANSPAPSPKADEQKDEQKENEPFNLDVFKKGSWFGLGVAAAVTGVVSWLTNNVVVGAALAALGYAGLRVLDGNNKLQKQNHQQEFNLFEAFKAGTPFQPDGPGL